MSIKTAILALSPLVYWPLDDLNSTTAADASGNGHTGVFYNGAALGAPGPEAGTTALASGIAGGGVNVQGNNPLAGVSTVTLMMWMAAAAYTAAASQAVYNGLSSATGSGLEMDGATLKVLAGGRGVATTGNNPAAGLWHQIAYTINTGSGAYNAYVDGTNVLVGAGGAQNVVVGGNPLVGLCPDPGIVAHAAFWNVVLTGAQILGVWNAGPGLVAAANVSGRAANDADILALETKLELIIASVIRQY